MKYDLSMSKLPFKIWIMPNGEQVNLKYKLDSDIYLVFCAGWENLSPSNSVIFEVSRQELVQEGWKE